MQRVLVLGGNGFIGYHICREFYNRDYAVTSAAWADPVLDPLLSQVARIETVDIDQLNEAALKELIIGHDVLVYALGPDDRVQLEPGVSASDYFQRYLVRRTNLVCHAARQVGVKKIIIISSYFNYFNQLGLKGLKPGDLAKRHPYIKARVDQAEQAISIGDANPEVVILELPYVFGTTPGNTPLWKEIWVDRFAKWPFVIYGRGRTSVVSVQKAALAVVQAARLAPHASQLPVASADFKYKALIKAVLRASGVPKICLAWPAWLLTFLLRRMTRQQTAQQRSNGLDYRYLAKDILSQNLVVDFAATDQLLAMTAFEDDVKQSITELGQQIKQIMEEANDQSN